MVNKRLAFIIPLMALTLASCSKSNALESYLSSAHPSSHESLSLRNIYGDEWDEFAIVCPYALKDAVEAELYLENAPIPKFGLDESQSMLVLKSTNDDTTWIRFSRTKVVDLCPVASNYDVSFQSTDAAFEFKFNPTNNVWEYIN